MKPHYFRVTMKLFFCLALFSLSSAEPLFRFSLHRNKSVRHHLDQLSIPVEVVPLNKKSDDSAPFPNPLSTYPDAHNGIERERGIGFAVSGSCTTTPSNGAYNVYNGGSGHCYITYGDCSASTSNVPDITNSDRFWINDVRNEGSGTITITYCSSSTSSVPSNGKELIHNIFNAGHAYIYIKYLCGASPTIDNRKLMNDLYNGGSSEVYIEYKSCCPSFSGLPSTTNICGKMFNNIRSEGGGIIDIKYWDCGASPFSVPRSSNNCGKLGHDVYNAGGGVVYITYWNCGGLLSSVPSYSYGGELVDSVRNLGSGIVNIKYGKCSTTASSARSNTNIPENERTRRLTIKHARKGNNEKKESASESTETDPICQEMQVDKEGVPTKMRQEKE